MVLVSMIRKGRPAGQDEAIARARKRQDRTRENMSAGWLKNGDGKEYFK